LELFELVGNIELLCEVFSFNVFDPSPLPRRRRSVFWELSDLIEPMVTELRGYCLVGRARYQTVKRPKNIMVDGFVVNA
jgi:hypothetical protein